MLNCKEVVFFCCVLRVYIYIVKLFLFCCVLRVYTHTYMYNVLLFLFRIAAYPLPLWIFFHFVCNVLHNSSNLQGKRGGVLFLFYSSSSSSTSITASCVNVPSSLMLAIDPLRFSFPLPCDVLCSEGK
jgi:hypothetical protein